MNWQQIAQGIVRYFWGKWQYVLVGGMAQAAGYPAVLASDGKWDPSLIDNADIDHGSIGGNTDDDHAQYALLAGRSGGQTLKGGTGSGDDLTLTSTNHATKGTVFIQPNGGTVGILNAAPDGTVHIGDTGGGDTTVEMLIQSDGGRTFIAAAHDSGKFTHFGTQSNHNFRIVTNDTEVLRLETDGKMSHGAFTALMFEHSHDGTSGRLFGTVNVTDGTAQTIIADSATLDVKDILFYEVIVDPSIGASGYVSGNTTPTGTTITVFDSGGTETLVLHCNANGSVDLQRTAGTRTYVCSVRLFWQ